jgi:hypothetical protein
MGLRKYNSVALDSEGNARQNVNVEIRNIIGGGLAALFEDDEATSKGNPLTTDSRGRFSFKIADGEYSIKVVGDDPSLITEEQIIFLPPAAAALAGRVLKVSSAGYIISNGLFIPEYDALVGSGSEATHATLQAAINDAGIVAGSKILVTESAALVSAVTINKPNLEIVFKSNVTYSAASPAPNNAIDIQAGGDGVIIRGGRFGDFSGGGNAAINLNVNADYVTLRDMRFFNNTKDIEDNSNLTYSSTGHISE